MAAEKLAKRYAKALFEDTLSKGELEKVNDDMRMIARTISDSKELKVFLKSPIIKAAKKSSVLTQIFGDKISKESFALIQLLVEKNREGYLDEIARAFALAYNEYNHILEVKVTTAVALDSQMEDQIKKVILSKVGEKKLIIESIIDPKIMGGFIIDLGNKVYDASVRNKLSNVAHELILN